MFVKKLLSGILSAALIATSIPTMLAPANVAKAAASPEEITIEKTKVSNPILGYDDNGDLLYGGDPSVLVDGDTLYLFTGRDSSLSEGYYMLEWQCYSTKDLKSWKNEGVVMKADKKSITWANTGTDAWAGQIAKYKDKYYFYYCTWDRTSSGQQSIGVAVADKPTGPYTDIGEPLVKGTFTTQKGDGLSHSGGASDWNDIDPTVWIETDSKGIEHRYLNWGNGRNFTCELNEDMISVKDINNDGKITFGTQASDATSATDDVIEMIVPSSYTEAPWLYRRTDSTGKYTGDYYLFYAYAWREQMAYATMDSSKGLMNGKFTFQKILMPPTATSNTNHMAVFDFKDKTYFIYHNGSLPGGSGFRRTACITEMKFNDDGSIQPIPESAIGITGDTPYTIYSSNGTVIAHEKFENSSDDGSYPYTDIQTGTFVSAPATADTEWAIVAGKADSSKDSYVSIQSENKPGLYLTANEDNTITLAQDYKYSSKNGKILADADTAKAQTFKTVKGLNDAAGVSFESVLYPGMYMTLCGGSLGLTNGSNKAQSTFYLNDAPTGITPNPGTGTDATVKSVSVNGKAITASNNTYQLEVPFDQKSVTVDYVLNDTNAYVSLNNKMKGDSTGSFIISTTGQNTAYSFTVYAGNGTTKATYTINIKKSTPTNIAPIYKTSLSKYYTFENESTNGAYAVAKGIPITTIKNPSYTYVDGVSTYSKNAIYLNGSYGLRLCDTEDIEIGSNYSITFWMKPDSLGSNVDPLLAAGTFSPEYWLNLTQSGRGIWSHNSTGFVECTPTPSKSFTPGVWQHVALTVKGSKANLYLDGELIQSGSIASNIMTKELASIYIGVNGWDNYFKGAIDEIGIFNEQLTEAQILSLAYHTTDVEKISKATVPVDTPQQPSGTVTKPSTGTNVGTNTNSSNNVSLKKATITVKNGKKKVSKVNVKKKKKVTLKVTVNSKATLTMKKLSKKDKKIVAATFKKGKLTIKGKKKGTVKIKLTAKKTATYKEASKTITVKVK